MVDLYFSLWWLRESLFLFLPVNVSWPNLRDRYKLFIPTIWSEVFEGVKQKQHLGVKRWVGCCNHFTILFAHCQRDLDHNPLLKLFTCVKKSICFEVWVWTNTSLNSFFTCGTLRWPLCALMSFMWLALSWSIRGLMAYPAERRHICCGPFVAAHSFTPGSPYKAPRTSLPDPILVPYHQHLPLDSWRLVQAD